MEITCPVCSRQTTARPLVPAAHPSHRYLLCDGCGTGHLEHAPERPEDLYTEDYFVEGGELAGYVDYEADERWHRINARARLRRLHHALGLAHIPGRLVEVGSATGFFLDVAREAGWQTHGVEASTWAARRARDKGHDVTDQLATLDVDPVDAVCFFQVLEHMPDPAGALREAARRLRPGGVVLCETWDVNSATARRAGARWQQLSPPSVLWLFNRDAMSHLARETGLEMVNWRTTTKWVSVATVLGQSVPIVGRGRAGRALRTAGRWAAVRYPLDDLVTFTLVKRDMSRSAD
ncbi:methyltransferase family protein [Luteococcus japonicus]|uniref:Methyltransferase family protein n=1 Tax=Luteococcus japonicus TaxID=33984 RepID=A0A3N1ZWJ9_9ACTN|nr:class I SAM-dependent methyltransferase [Luteococcus japonicus]ROR55231.1 methyltransferase family protein [Luteococcus japonicus]